MLSSRSLVLLAEQGRRPRPVPPPVAPPTPATRRPGPMAGLRRRTGRALVGLGLRLALS